MIPQVVWKWVLELVFSINVLLWLLTTGGFVCGIGGKERWRREDIGCMDERKGKVEMKNSLRRFVSVRNTMMFNL